MASSGNGSGRHGHVLSFCEGVVHGLKKANEMGNESEAYREGVYYGLRESALENQVSKKRLGPVLAHASEKYGSDPDFDRGRVWGREEWERAKKRES